MNARDGVGDSVKQPLRLVVDSQLKTPVNAAILGADKNCIIFYSQQDSTTTAGAKSRVRKGGFYADMSSCY